MVHFELESTLFYALIGARSSVFSDMPEGMICIGSPAKPVKSRI
jgi:putative colanic acid biosynthesis acetyltransferase WcaF